MQAAKIGVLRVGLVIAAALLWVAGAAAPVGAQQTSAEAERQKRIETFFITADTDKDGFITQGELKFMIVRIFDLIDVDGSTYIERDEVPGLSATEFDKADLDNDGKLSALEFINADFIVFQRMDLNGDGKVTLDELIAYLDTLR